MKFVQVLVVGVTLIASSKAALPQQAARFSFARTLRLIEDSGTRDLGGIGLALMAQKSRFRAPLATASPIHRAIINRHFDDLIDLTFEKKRVYETYSGGVRAQHKMRLENWARNIRSSIPLADESLWNLGLGGTPPPPPKPQAPLISRYPQSPVLEPSWKRAQRAERAQLGSVGKKARPALVLKPPTSGVTRKQSAATQPEAEEAVGIPSSVRSLATLSSAALSESEIKYLGLVQEFVQATAEIDISTAPAKALATPLTEVHDRLKGIWEMYLQLPASKRFAQIDPFIRQGMVSEMTAFQFAAEGARTGYWWTWKMSRVPHQEGQTLLAQASRLLPLLPVNNQ